VFFFREIEKTKQLWTGNKRKESWTSNHCTAMKYSISRARRTIKCKIILTRRATAFAGFCEGVAKCI
jgi:hypothetical protein